MPLTVFALDYCIKYPQCSLGDVAAKELDKVTLDFGVGESDGIILRRPSNLKQKPIIAKN